MRDAVSELRICNYLSKSVVERNEILDNLGYQLIVLKRSVRVRGRRLRVREKREEIEKSLKVIVKF